MTFFQTFNLPSSMSRLLASKLFFFSFVFIFRNVFFSKYVFSCFQIWSLDEPCRFVYIVPLSCARITIFKAIIDSPNQVSTRIVLFSRRSYISNQNVSSAQIRTSLVFKSNHSWLQTPRFLTFSRPKKF